jgi:SAM-dependent methyltransferase
MLAHRVRGIGAIIDGKTATARELVQALADAHLQGVGIEIGAGLRPLQPAQADKIHYHDKRDPRDFERLFGVSAPYEIQTLDHIQQENPDGVDFVSAFQVLEHADDPIAVAASWMKLLRAGGLIFVTVPAADNVIESGRPITPLRHMLEDHFFGRSGDSYESKGHIFSFISACAASGGELMPWYAKEDVESYARRLLFEVKELDDHDLHWHTYDLKTLVDVIGIAFAVGGHTAEIVEAIEYDNCLFVVARKAAYSSIPAPLRDFERSLRAAADQCAQITGTPRTERSACDRPSTRPASRGSLATRIRKALAVLSNTQVDAVL